MKARMANRASTANAARRPSMRALAFSSTMASATAGATFASSSAVSRSWSETNGTPLVSFTWTSFSLRTNPTEGVDGAAYGYANMGPYAGGQAEFLRVPYADFNLLELPPGDDFERDFTMLSDIFPTGYHGCDL